MELSTRTKTTTAVAAGILLAGFAVILASAPHDNLAGAIGGACLVMVGLSLTILTFVCHWVSNTAEERRILGAAQREAQAERSRYFAAQAALENERGRLLRDLAAERASIAATLAAERAAMAAEFQETRATELSEAFQTGVEMERTGMLQRRQPQRGNLLKFPGRQPSAPARTQEREHGVVGP
ncbi:hypothetical protein [Streptomyces werraensis]|uniref:hypothetical protein n=1 Tax=Streptomyces werraensis TaxID=68284 RepID=UPI0036C54D93